MISDAFLDSLLALPRLGSAGVSRDGRWAAWTWFGIGETADVWAAPTDGSRPPVRLSRSNQNTLFVTWSHDGTWVLAEEDEGGDEHMVFYRLDIEQPGRMIPLTEPRPDWFARGAALSPDDRTLVVGGNLDPRTWEPAETSWLIAIDLATGARRGVAGPAKSCGLDPVINPQGTRILYRRADRNAAGRQLWSVGWDGRGDGEVVCAGDRLKVWGDWLADGRRALVMAESATHVRLGVREEDGRLCWLIDDERRAIDGAFRPDGQDKIVVIDCDRAKPRPSFLDPATGEEQRLPAVPGVLQPLAPAPGGRWVARYGTASRPGDLVAFHPAEVEPDAFEGLTGVTAMSGIASGDLAPAQEVFWRSVDGLEVQGWLTRARDPRGLVVWVHGGPTRRSEDWLNPQIQYLVHRGFNVLDPNYRGSTGFGLVWRDLVRAGGFGGPEQDDIRTGIEAMINRGHAVPGRIGITGTSFGGYSSWCAATRLPPALIAAAAPVCGMTDLVIDYVTTRPDLRAYSEEMMGGSPTEVPAIYRERSPIHDVHRISCRLLIVQGMRDPNVTPENVTAVRAALDAARVPYELLAFDDEGHGIRRPANQRRLWHRLADFFSESFAS